MKTFILLLILAALLQSSFLPLNLVLILLICRSFVVLEYSNLILGFSIGILLGILTSQNIGFWPLVFLIMIKLASSFKKLPISSNALTIIPFSLIIVLLTSVTEKIFLNQSINISKVIAEATISLPVFLLIRLWEERFIVRSEIKLKV